MATSYSPLLQVLSDRVLVRVGGGWDTLDHFLLKHDPCRCGLSGALYTHLLSVCHCATFYRYISSILQ